MYRRSHELDSMGATRYQAALAAMSRGGSPRLDYLRARAAAEEAALVRDGLVQESALSPYEKIEVARGNDLMYGLDSGAAGVGAGLTATLTVTPQKKHIPQRIVLSAAVASNFVITDIRAGVEPILATVGAISAAVFIQDATTPPFRAVVMEVGMDFSITVTNVSAAIARFTCTVIGRYLPSSL